jgi:hypothetical protein
MQKQQSLSFESLQCFCHLGDRIWLNDLIKVQPGVVIWYASLEGHDDAVVFMAIKGNCSFPCNKHWWSMGPWLNMDVKRLISEGLSRENRVLPQQGFPLLYLATKRENRVGQTSYWNVTIFIRKHEILTKCFLKKKISEGSKGGCCAVLLSIWIKVILFVSLCLGC